MCEWCKKYRDKKTLRFVYPYSSLGCRIIMCKWCDFPSFMAFSEDYYDEQS